MNLNATIKKVKLNATVKKETLNAELRGVLVRGGSWGSITGTLSDQTDLQNALNLKANSADLSLVATSGDHIDLINKGTNTHAQIDIDLARLANTSGTNTGDQDLSPYQLLSEKGVANGYASLDGAGFVPSSQLPSYVDDVLEYANLSSFPITGETGKIYVALDTNNTYRWSGTAYIELTDSTAIWGDISGTLSNQTDLQNALNLKANTADLATVATSGLHSSLLLDDGTNPHGTTKADVGLGSVENTALSTWTGSTNLTTLGTITTGTWNGTPITNDYLAGIVGSKVSLDTTTFNNNLDGTVTNVQLLADAVDELTTGSSVWSRDAVNGYLYPSTLTDKVGIGTATPSSNSNLEVKSNSGFSLIKATSVNGTEAIVVGGDDGWARFGSYTNNRVAFIVNNLARGVINLTGDWGIGTQSQSARLHIVGAGNTSATFAQKIENSSGTNLLSVRDDGRWALSDGVKDYFYYNKVGSSGNGFKIEQSGGSNALTVYQGSVEGTIVSTNKLFLGGSSIAFGLQRKPELTSANYYVRLGGSDGYAFQIDTSGGGFGDQPLNDSYWHAQNAGINAITNITGGKLKFKAGDGSLNSINAANGGNVEIDGGTGYGTGTKGDVKIQGLTYPKIDGAVNEVLKTDGAGNIDFADISTLLSASTTWGFNGTTPSATQTGYTTANVTTDRTLDVSTATTTELANVLSTLIEDLKTKGILSA